MSNSYLILLVDDEEVFREIFSAKLAASGYEVRVAHDGEEAVELVQELKPDLVLMDVQMPKKNGVEALLKIKENPECRDLKVMFLTALGDAHDVSQEINRRLSKEVGAVGYLKKEENLDTLVDHVRTLLP